MSASERLESGGVQPVPPCMDLEFRGWTRAVGTMENSPQKNEVWRKGSEDLQLPDGTILESQISIDFLFVTGTSQQTWEYITELVISTQKGSTAAWLQTPVWGLFQRARLESWLLCLLQESPGETSWNWIWTWKINILQHETNLAKNRMNFNQKYISWACPLTSFNLNCS